MLVNDDMVSPEPQPIHQYPPTIKEMGWSDYLTALSDRLDAHLPNVVGARAKKDIKNAAKVLRAFGDLEIVTQYLDSLPND